MTEFLPFALPELGDEEIAEVVDSLRSGWLSTGPKVKRLEEDFRTFLGGGIEVVAVNSATAGLHLALEALGVGCGDEVIVPTHTFTASAEVVRYLGADVRFVDIERRSYCMDPEQLDLAIESRTKAVIPVHFAGMAADMASILSICRKRGVAVVEDAAHALPTAVNGELVGRLPSDCCVFSFYANKTMTTGEGGMLVTANGDIARRARVMRLHGIDRDAFDRFRAKRAAWQYEVIAPGFKYNMPDIAAAIGIHQLRKLPQFHLRRIELAARYDSELRDLPLHLPPRNEPSEHAWHLYVVRLSDAATMSRDVLVERLFEAGIGTSVHYTPLHLQPYWRDSYELRPSMFPISQWLFEGCLSLPLYTSMTDDDQTRVIRALRSLLA